jgi:bifunctional DNA-binding transcriptional regulator/antitoxin component of YhaV-PrlF toxin-antitoxin module
MGVRISLIVEVRERGVFILPAELREKYAIEKGRVFQWIDIEGVLVLVPMVPIVSELACQIDKIRLEAGLTMDQLLEALRQQRQSAYNGSNDAS